MSVDTPEASFDCRRCGAEYADADACPSCGLLREPVPCDDDPARQARVRCVICGRAVCSADTPDNPARCADHASIPVIEGWAQVYSTTSDIEAGLIAQNLQSEGVDAQVYSQKDDIFPVDLGELSVVRVLVPVWEFASAREIVISHMDTAGEVAFACPACGEAYEPGAETCTSCGAVLAGNGSA